MRSIQCMHADKCFTRPTSSAHFDVRSLLMAEKVLINDLAMQPAIGSHAASFFHQPFKSLLNVDRWQKCFNECERCLEKGLLVGLVHLFFNSQCCLTLSMLPDILSDTFDLLFLFFFVCVC